MVIGNEIITITTNLITITYHYQKKIFFKLPLPTITTKIFRGITITYHGNGNTIGNGNGNQNVDL
jgi:hypothetical protein